MIDDAMAVLICFMNFFWRLPGRFGEGGGGGAVDI